ncbi:MAG: hypothetical protein ABJF01_17910 [bacterium]
MSAPPRRRPPVSTGPAKLTSSLSRRLDNQIARAYQHTYGARTGLRALVRQGTREMLTAGAAPDAIRDAFRQCVSNHVSAAPSDKSSVLTGESESATLTELMLVWVDEACSPAAAEGPQRD